MENELGAMSDDDNNEPACDEELIFGEVVFEVKMREAWIGVDIKMYMHPSKSADGKCQHHDCQWNRFYAPFNLFKNWFLSMSLPQGATAQILSLEIDNEINFNTRESIKKENENEYDSI